MDNQPMPPHSASPEAGLSGASAAEGLKAGAPERAASAAELTPAGAAGGAAGGTAQPKLTAADVAAAIAAVPGPAAPLPMSVSGPVAASDVDVIEPEWVAKAEEVVAAHQGDPYGEEEAIEDLQRDYLQKRYGHTVGDPDAGADKPKAP